MKRILFVCGIAALMAVPVSSAGRAAPTLSATPNPVVSGLTVQWSGCGYKAGELLWLQVYQAGGSTQPGGNEYERADASGCFSSAVWTVDWAAASYTASVFDASNTGGRPKPNPLASTAFQVIG